MSQVSSRCNFCVTVESPSHASVSPRREHVGSTAPSVFALGTPPCGRGSFGVRRLSFSFAPSLSEPFSPYFPVQPQRCYQSTFCH